MKTIAMCVLMSLSINAMAVTGKVATLAESRSYIEKTDSLKAYRDAAKTGHIDAKMKQAVVRYLSDATSTISGLDAQSLEVYTSMNREDGLAKVIQLTSTVKSGTTEQKAKAEIDLKILSAAAKFPEATSEEISGLEKVTEMADFNQNAKDFKSKLLVELDKGTSIKDAISKASGGKITLEDIKNCLI